MNINTKVLTVLLMMFLTPLTVFGNTNEVNSTVVILGYYTLASVVVIGMTTSILVLINARKMKGGVFGKVLEYFSAGMFLLLLGFIVSSISFSTNEGVGFIAKTMHDILYILGFIIMAIAARKLLATIKGDGGV